MSVKKLKLKNADFPEILKHIPGPPKELYVLGDLPPLLEKPRVAIVGSRKVTPYGRQVTQQLAGELAKAGIVIISGLALGIDAIAHHAALEAGGKCIAVLPTSLDNIYPSSHRQLAENILKGGGVLLTEYAPTTEGFPANFVARNRLVSGLSDGVLIPEAALKSGTLHTANFALDQGRVVMAVPGNINSATSQGANNLLKSGAILVTEAQDIFTALKLTPKDMQRQLPLASNEAEQLILDMLAAGISDGGVLLAESKLTPGEFNQTLTMLEIAGKITPLGAGNWSIR